VHKIKEVDYQDVPVCMGSRLANELRKKRLVCHFVPALERRGHMPASGTRVPASAHAVHAACMMYPTPLHSLS
jgi:hypothetical protein